MRRPAYLVDLREPVAYLEAWELQRALAGAVSQGAIPDTVVLLEHPPVITLGRRAEQGELHIPEHAEVEIVESDRGGKSTYHAPGQLVCYPILDLTRHGQDVKKYCRDLELALIATLEPLGIEAKAIDGLTGLWVDGNATRPDNTRTRADVIPNGDSAPGPTPRHPPRSRRSASTSTSGSRRTGTRSTSISTRRRSPTGSQRVAWTARPSQPPRRSSGAQSPSTTSGRWRSRGSRTCSPSISRSYPPARAMASGRNLSTPRSRGPDRGRIVTLPQHSPWPFEPCPGARPSDTSGRARCGGVLAKSSHLD